MNVQLPPYHRHMDYSLSRADLDNPIDNKSLTKVLKSVGIPVTKAKGDRPSEKIRRLKMYEKPDLDKSGFV
jgi:hypothetical protein